VNSAQGIVFNILWANGVTNPYTTLPEVIIVVFNYYTGLPFTIPNNNILQKGGKLIIPILPVKYNF